MLPNEIAKLWAHFNFECQLPDDDSVWSPAGTSTNVVYVTLAQPIGGPLCETLLEIGCIAASGRDSRLGAFWPIWNRFDSLCVTRLDGARLTYYDPSDPSKAKSEDDTPSTDIRTKTTTILAKESVSKVSGDCVLANCIGISTFLISCLRAQGIHGTRRVRVDSNGPNVADISNVNNRKGLLIARWRFATQDSTITPYNWIVHWNIPNDNSIEMGAINVSGVEGHNNDDPVSVFSNHFIVEFYIGQPTGSPIDYGWVVCDPSYGGWYWNRRKFEFESRAKVVGLTIVDNSGDIPWIRAMEKDVSAGAASTLTFTEEDEDQP